VFRQTDVEFEIAQDNCRSNSGHQNGGEHCRHDDIEQIVSSIERGDSYKQHGDDVGDADTGDVVVKDVPQTGDGNPPGKIGHSGQTYDHRQQQRHRGQDQSSPQASRFASHRGKKRSRESQDQSDDCQKEAHPDLGDLNV